ncbi:MAG: hypothetical protein H7338_20100 [Candidatus Sericytochromatia bacterium]|nr:hypothetical protein [Candidatus Sericytochromatia bacterium]
MMRPTTRELPKTVASPVITRQSTSGRLTTNQEGAPAQTPHERSLGLLMDGQDHAADVARLQARLGMGPRKSWWRRLLGS